MNDCVHHWVLPSEAGLYAKGECKKCGSSKWFVNAIDGRLLDWKIRHWEQKGSKNTNGNDK